MQCLMAYFLDISSGEYVIAFLCQVFAILSIIFNCVLKVSNIIFVPFSSLVDVIGFSRSASRHL